MNSLFSRKEENIRKAFATFDTDGNGFISEDELKKICEKHDIRDESLQEIIAQVDKVILLSLDTCFFFLKSQVFCMNGCI